MQATDLLQQNSFWLEELDGDNVENDPINSVDPDGLSPTLPSEAEVLFSAMPKQEAEANYRRILQTQQNVSNILLMIAPELAGASSLSERIRTLGLPITRQSLSVSNFTAPKSQFGHSLLEKLSAYRIMGAPFHCYCKGVLMCLINA